MEDAITFSVEYSHHFTKIVHISLTRVKSFEANNSANTISPYYNYFISVITAVKIISCNLLMNSDCQA